MKGLVLSRNRNMYTIHAATIKHMKIGHKSDVTTVAMVTLTIQDGGYFGFKRILLQKSHGYPPFLFYKTLCYSAMHYMTNFKKIL